MSWPRSALLFPICVAHTTLRGAACPKRANRERRVNQSEPDHAHMLILDVQPEQAVPIVIGWHVPLRLPFRNFLSKGLPDETRTFHDQLKHLRSCTIHTRDYFD